MAVRTIITAPDSRLKIKSKSVIDMDDTLQTLVDDMFDTMYSAPGIGLSAIQIGVPKRVIVIHITHENDVLGPLVLINPEVLVTSEEKAIYEEGCLSLPDQFVEIERPREITLSYLNREGDSVEKKFSDIYSTCIQHEIDHLHGKLFVDHLSLVRRNIILRKLSKARRMAKATV